MTILKCSATKCMYNENELCSRGDIEITGDGVHRNADETSCGSFRERNASGAAMNSEARPLRLRKDQHRLQSPGMYLQRTTANVPPPPLMSPDAVQKAAMRQNAAPSACKC